MAYAIIVPDVAKIRHAQARILGTWSPIDGHSTLHFFANQPTLGPSTILSDFVEIVLAGYAPIALAGASDDGIVAGDRDEWEWPTTLTTAAATPGSPVTAYGYWVTSNDDGALLWCQTFDVSWTWTVAGDTMSFKPTLYLGQIIP
jgi:hypothetical protein